MATVEQGSPGVYRAINSIQAELARKGISKDRTNRAQGYQFRGIDDVYNALSPLLAQHGLCILPRVLERECSERPTRNDGVMFAVTVRVEFDFICSTDGSRHTVSTFGEAMDTGDKATNKAISQAYKNCALQAFAIPTEGDNDPDAHTHEVVTPKAAPAPSSPPRSPQRGASQPNSREGAATPSAQQPAKGPAADQAKGKVDPAVRQLAAELSRLAESMGFANSDMHDVVLAVYNAKSIAVLPHATVATIKADLAQKAALYVQIRDAVKQIYFDRDAFEPDSPRDQAALQDKVQEVLADKASLDFASRPLRAKAESWKGWLAELKAKLQAG